jgi:hypothetical protein
MARTPTPIVDDYLAHLDPQSAQAVAEIDAAELDRQRAEVAPHIAEKLDRPTRSVERRLRSWEALAAKLATGGDYYLIDEYVNDLDIRDALEGLRAGLPASFGELLDRLDKDFRDVTLEDGGEALRWRVRRSEAETALRHWWWRRRPKDLPWAE